MRCCSSSSLAKDRCVFTSVLLLGAMLAMQATPCARPSLMPLFVLLGVIPLVTFGVAAPTRIGLGRELLLLGRGLEALSLGALLRLLGRAREAAVVAQRHRERVERAYLASEERFAEVVKGDPLRLHHARRLAFAVTSALVLAGLSLPILQPSVYTFGEWPTAPLVVLLDLVTLGVVGRVVTERVGLRLLETTHGVSARRPLVARLGIVPVASMLGVALGAVGGLVVVGAGAIACAIETSWVAGGVSLAFSASWFIAQTAIDGMAFGMAVGAIFGAGLGLAQKPWRAQG